MAVEKDQLTPGLKSQANELIKQHIEFDGFKRPSVVYTAQINVKAGQPCTTVTYQYLEDTSSRVSGMKEGVGTWNGAWDF